MDLNTELAPPRPARQPSCEPRRKATGACVHWPQSSHSGRPCSRPCAPLTPVSLCTHCLSMQGPQALGPSALTQGPPGNRSVLGRTGLALPRGWGVPPADNRGCTGQERSLGWGLLWLSVTASLAGLTSWAQRILRAQPQAWSPQLFRRGQGWFTLMKKGLAAQAEGTHQPPCHRVTSQARPKAG